MRILATTNRDLPAEVRRGTFREDLYFRLNVVRLRIPPLRERPGDIAALAEHFCPPLRRRERLAVPAADADGACCAWSSHHWRGNVRELENTIHRAVLLADGAEIGADGDRTRPSRRRAVSRGETTVAGGVASLVGRRMDEVERDLIIETLGHTLGNRTHAATILGISIRALAQQAARLRRARRRGAAARRRRRGLTSPHGRRSHG